MKTGITVDQLFPSLEGVLEEVALRLTKAGFQRPVSEENLVTISRVLYQRGDSYGEDFPFQIGELGLLYLTLTKLLRLKWALTQGEVSSRTMEEHWLDLAGYAILALAAHRYRDASISVPDLLRPHVPGFPVDGQKQQQEGRPLLYVAGPVRGWEELAQTRERQIHQVLAQEDVALWMPWHVWGHLGQTTEYEEIYISAVNDRALSHSSALLVGMHLGAIEQESKGTLREIRLAAEMGIPIIGVFLADLNDETLERFWDERQLLRLLAKAGKTISGYSTTLSNLPQTLRNVLEYKEDD